MSRDEIIKPQPTTDSIRNRLLEKILQARESQRKMNRLWLTIQPMERGELKLTSDFQEYFSNPLKTGNRGVGWTFVNPYERMQRDPDGGIRFGHSDSIWVRVSHHGGIEFTIPIANLYWKSANGIREALGNEIWPYCLLEYPVSVFRLARTIYLERNFQSNRFLADLALFGVRGWTLRPHSPMAFAYKGLARPNPLDADEIVFSEPLELTRKQVIEAPDRCAFRLVRRVYEAFGIAEENIPAEFNQESGKLALPV